MNWFAGFPSLFYPAFWVQNFQGFLPQFYQSHQLQNNQMQAPQNYRKYGVRRKTFHNSLANKRPAPYDSSPYPNKTRRPEQQRGPGQSNIDHNGNSAKRASSGTGRYFTDELTVKDDCLPSSSTSVGKERPAVKRKAFPEQGLDFISLNASEPASKQRRLGGDEEFGSVAFSTREARRLFESDSFSEQIVRFFKENQQRPEFLRKKLQLKSAMQNAITYAAIRNSSVFLVGSSVNGFGRITSDADFCLVTNDDSGYSKKERKKVMRTLVQVKRLLERAPFVGDLQIIPAKVPIIKFTDRFSGMECDVNVDNLTGIRNTELMRQYSRLDPRVRPLALVVKEWAHQHHINDASKGTLNSYSIILMIVHFLQHGTRPAILPSLQQKHPELFTTTIPVNDIYIEDNKIPPYRSQNQSTISELLQQFFEYFAEFNFRNDIMSVRLGKIIKIHNVKNIRPWQNKELKVEEPFDLSNTARAVHNPVVARQIFQKFKEANERLKRGTNGLSSILRNVPSFRHENSVIVLDD